MPEVVTRKSNNFLGVKNIFKDIKEMPTYFKFFLAIGIIVILFFNFFDVTGSGSDLFLPLSQYHQTLENGSTFGSSNSAAIVIAVLYSLNGLASFTGLIAVAMIVQGRTSQYFWGAINAIFYGLFSISVGYAGDFFMQIILLLGAPIGWYLFEVKGLAYKEEKRQTWRQNLFLTIYALIALAIIILVLYEFLPQGAQAVFHNNPYVDGPGVKGNTMLVLDSMVNGFNIVGYAMQLTNLNQQFFVWLATDILRVLKFSSLAGSNTLSINMLIEFVIWVSSDFIGIYERYFRGKMFIKSSLSNSDKLVKIKY